MVREWPGYKFTVSATLIHLSAPLLSRFCLDSSVRSITVAVLLLTDYISCTGGIRPRWRPLAYRSTHGSADTEGESMSDGETHGCYSCRYNSPIRHRRFPMTRMFPIVRLPTACPDFRPR